MKRGVAGPHQVCPTSQLCATMAEDWSAVEERDRIAEERERSRSHASEKALAALRYEGLAR